MPSATYVSVLVRSHLRNLAPLPTEELSALKRSVAELRAIGRNLNQIARAANQGGRPSEPGREELQAMLRVASRSREGITPANQIAWKQGPDQAARELERCVTKLGFKGVMVNGYTQVESQTIWSISTTSA
jgi:Bacterial mobilisation protein (MobC)